MTAYERRLRQARTALLLDHPFFGTLLFRHSALRTLGDQIRQTFILTRKSSPFGSRNMVILSL